jgi:uncharacterized membrane protein YedE/YeeE
VNPVRLVSLGFGVAFGFLLSWAQLTSPDVIREALLLEDSYMYLLMASAVAVGFAGTRLLRRFGAHALVTGERVSWSVQRPERRHVVGSVIFGFGWALSDACPGPIAAQLGQGFGWSLFTAAGVVAGVLIFLRRQEPARAPATTSGVAYASAPE